MADNARGIHVSPGVYSREIDITYAVKSLGITTLGAAGETLRGPAFQPMMIGNWRQFENTFGGTSTERFKGSQYPKYELPYIAKSYLNESQQLQVCRILGLSGYNAGPAWVVTAEGADGKKYAVAVIRSRGEYIPFKKFRSQNGDCICSDESYDHLYYNVGEPKNLEYGCERVKYYIMDALQIGPYQPINSSGNECDSYKLDGGSIDDAFNISPTNLGRFRLCGISGTVTPEQVEELKEAVAGNVSYSGENYFEYSVSFNPADSDYILRVLGSTAQDGDAPIYVESLYDVAIQQMIADNKIVKISDSLTSYQPYMVADFCGLESISGFARKQETELRRQNIGQRFIADAKSVADGITCHKFDYKTNKPTGDATTMEVGTIYTVVQYVTEGGVREYYYKSYDLSTAEDLTGFEKLNAADKLVDGSQWLGNESSISGYDHYAVAVKNNENGQYYRLNENSSDVVMISTDLNNYKSQYRFASTPWFVSNVKGDFNKIELNKLFRFHTISDGDSSNFEIKVSIENILPDEGKFDVIIRDINDTDESAMPLEKFFGCTMKKSSKNYIGAKIGTYDGIYESKSKYIVVEVMDSQASEMSVPAGFIGYPMANFNGYPVLGTPQEEPNVPNLMYNTDFDEEIKNRKQYFGLSTWTGVDVDAFTFKGSMAYIDNPAFITHGFHLDSRLNTEAYTDGKMPKIYVDGQEGYVFDAVSTNARTSMLVETPIIASEVDMYGSIYEYKNLRKFTAYFYGGFDGWDVYRTSRSNTDEFKMTQYKGTYTTKSGEGYAFSKIQNPDALGLNQGGITSDWYAYLTAYRQFSNPEAVDINVFVTPGIDYVNNKLLVEEVIEMIESERADSIYVVTTPDKPFGTPDYTDELYLPDDAVYNLEDSGIDSNYTCTYYPWVKYYDQEHNHYIFLPPTRDVVRNFAMTDNTAYPWFAPAGLERGNVDCVKARYITRVGDEDVLYENRINPIKTFANDGVKIWGQKNLQIAESQLNRIAVRRLLLRMRKLISIACLSLIFEPNDSTTRNSFLSIVTPIMDNIRANRGISDYKIEVGESVEGEDCRELNCKIYFKPYCALEYISLDFIVTPESVSFDDI